MSISNKFYAIGRCLSISDDAFSAFSARTTLASRPCRGILLENVNGGETGVAVKYIPKTDIEFPSAPDAHLLAVKPSHPVDLSEGYPFRNKSFGFRFCQFWFRIFLHLIVLPVVRIRYCLKVEGRVDRSTTQG